MAISACVSCNNIEQDNMRGQWPMISGNVSSAGISAVTEGRECYDDKIAGLKTRGLGLLKGVQHF